MQWRGRVFALALALAVAAPACAAEALEDRIAVDPEGVIAELDQSLPTLRDPAARARALQTKALAQSRLSRWDAARADLVTALALAPRADEDLRAELFYARSVVESDQLEFVAGLEAAAEARTIWQRLHGKDDLRTIRADTSWGMSAMALGRTAEALPLLEHGWQVASRLLPPGNNERADVGIYFATALSRSRMSDRAEPLLRQLLAESALLPEGHAMRAKVRISMGSELMSQGRTGEAIPILREGVEEGVNARGLIIGERANALGVLGSALLSQDRPEDAAAFLAAAADLFGTVGRRSLQASAMILGGGAADRAGDRQRGLAMRQQALDIYRSLPNGSELGIALSQFKLAQSLANTGRLDEAESAAAQAAEVLGRLRAPTHFQTTNSRISLGWIQVLRGNVAQGLPLVRDNFRLSVQVNEQQEVARSQVVGVLDNVEAYSQALDAALRGGDSEFAFEVLQVMIESDASRAAVAVAERESAGDSALGSLLRRRQEASAALGDAEVALTRQLGLEAASAATREQLQRQRDDHAARLAAIEAELDRAYPAFRTLLRPRRLALGEVQARLAPREVLLATVESDLGLVTMAISRREVAIGRSPLRRHDVRALVRRLRAGIDTGKSADFDLAAARALYVALFTPEVAALARPGTRLRVASGDILSALPLSVLVSQPGKDLATARFLIEDHALSVVPAIAALGDMPEDSISGGRLVAVGAPVEPADPALRRLGALPQAEREIAEMARMLSRGARPVVLTGKDATEARLRATNLHNVGVLLFATHGLVAGAFDARSEPALVLSPGGADGTANDGLLTASEAAALDTDAQWVVLSACDSAAGSQTSAAAYTGLARAFLFAGAHRVIASHWPVRDDMAARLSLGTIEAARDGKSPDEALRKAVLRVMHDRKLADARNPALWAPFMVVVR